MDWLEAVSSWIGSLAWPVVVLVLVIVFRSHLGGAIGKLRHLEAPGVKADFGNELAEAEAAAGALAADLPEAQPADGGVSVTEAPAYDHAPTNDTSADAPATESRPQMDRPDSTDSPGARVNRPDYAEPSAQQIGPRHSDSLGASEASTDPSGLIMRTWAELHGEVEEFAHGSGAMPHNSDRSASALVRELTRRKLLNDDAAELIIELADLRNRVAHGRHIPTPGEAHTYVGTAFDVIRYVRLSRERLYPDALARRLGTPRSYYGRIGNESSDRP